MTSTASGQTADTGHVPLNETGFALQLLLAGLLPLINAALFDWDAGMVAGLLIVEALVVLLMLPLLWTVLDLAWHRHKRGEGDEPATTFPWARRLGSNLLGLLVVLAFGGLLPILILSVGVPQWMDWAGNLAVTEFGVPAPLTLFLWPFALAWGLAGEWPGYALSVIAVALVAAVQVGSAAWQGLSRKVHPRELEDEATMQLSMVTVPLFIMAGIAWGIGQWFAERRVLPEPLAGEDVALWALVILTLMRSIVAGLGRRAQQATRAWQSGKPEAGRRGDGILLRGASVAGIVLAVLIGLAFAVSLPRDAGRTSAAIDCLASWPGDFRPASRAVLSPGNEAWLSDPNVACERLATATSLRLSDAIDPEDFAWFSGVSVLELSGGAAGHVADLHRLPALKRVSIVAGPALDARSIAPPPGLDLLAIARTPILHAEALWRLPALRALALSEVELRDANALRGRTRISDLGLRQVSGDVGPFLQGGLGITALRLRQQPLPMDARRGLYWVKRLEVDEDMPDADYCRLIDGLYSVRGARARDCGLRHAIKD